MSKFANSSKDAFLKALPVIGIQSETNLLTTYCKFNFAYFDVQPASQNFAQWSDVQKAKLFDKLRDYSKFSLKHWRGQCSGNGSVLATYGAFPRNSDFRHPAHVPHDAEWGRFRLEQKVRLVGFTLSSELNGKSHAQSKMHFDCNTFYVVFLDADHRFYKTERA